MEGGGLSVTTAVVLSETGSAAIGPVALTLSAETNLGREATVAGTQEDANASGSWLHRVVSGTTQLDR